MWSGWIPSRRAGALAMVMLAATPAAVAARGETEVLESLARVLALRDKCEASRLNFMALGQIMSQAGITDRSLLTTHLRAFMDALAKTGPGIEAMTPKEACEAMFALYGKDGTEVAGLVFAPHPDDFLNFVGKLAEGVEGLRGLFDRRQRTISK